MKRTLGWLLILALLVPLVSFAAEFRFGENTSIDANEKITNDVYLTGGSVTSAGNILGDLVVGGGNVVISGGVETDLTVGGGNVSILSDVGDDVRVGGGSVVIQGKVEDDLIVGGGNLTIGGPGIGGDLVVGAGALRLDAPVGGSVRIVGGEIYINSSIKGDVIIKAEKVTLGSGTKIYGNLTYEAKSQLTQDEGAVILGTVDFKERPKNTGAITMATLLSIAIFGKFLMLLVCALILGLVFKRYVKETINIAVERPLLELGRGLVVFAAIPVLSIVALVTIVGIPLGIVGLISFVALIIVAWTTAPLLVGSVVYKYFSKRELEISWKTIILGVFIYSILGIVPLIGNLAQMLILLVSLGTVFSIKWQALKLWR